MLCSSRWRTASSDDAPNRVLIVAYFELIQVDWGLYGHITSPSISLANWQSTRSVSHILWCSWRVCFSLVYIVWHKCLDQGWTLYFSVNAFPTVVCMFILNCCKCFLNISAEQRTKVLHTASSMHSNTTASDAAIYAPSTVDKVNLLVSVNRRVQQ